ncbi:G-type lectin S-receptor-like serine/threonine-protein kinase RKS1 [Vicia villosa]|uniref:G-type lectin S-receptor-like serine/threonine-protein kinase RKS1 n=1 Tax=Vicia villosa TaxID=3911 RepID=UPI00273B852A|nr:G-type lectin S-receptor-like serine/threonine-protein kinase RKS1 [Vicia villosa]
MDFAKYLSYLLKPQNHRLRELNGLLLNYLILLLFTFTFCSCSTDTVSVHKPIRDGDLLVSKSKTFALGFFTPGKSSSRYVGIWYYNLPIQTVVWVANRDTSINDTSGILSIDPNGNLVLHHNLSTIPIWSTNVSLLQSQTNNTSVIAQLSDTANLILILNNTKTVVWESFDHPTDTMLFKWFTWF